MAVISAHGAFRVMLILLAIWSFFEGFALFTGGFGSLALGGGDRTAERIIGLQMIGYVPVYALLAWRRDHYRLLVWVPYFAQLAIILPIAVSVLTGDLDGILLLTVSSIFFALLFYFWWHSHPLDFYAEDDEEDQDAAEEEDDLDEEEEPDDDDGTPAAPKRSRGTQPRDDPRRGRFRRRDS